MPGTIVFNRCKYDSKLIFVEISISFLEAFNMPSAPLPIPALAI
jgi:hypothetical protein